MNVSLSRRSYIACGIDFVDVYLLCIKGFIICYYLFSIAEYEHATFVIGLLADAFSCKVMLPSDVNASKLKCNVPSSAEKFFLC